MTHSKPRPSEVRELILAQHDELRALYADLDALLADVTPGDSGGDRALRERCRRLYQMLLRHIAVEDALLAPALRESDGFGPVRADELLAEHDRQRRLLRYALSSIVESTPGATLVRSLPPLLDSLRADMAHEERDLLSAELLKDDSTQVDAFGG